MVNEWIRSVIIFSVMAAFIKYMVPNDSYKKYIQTTIGFVMIIVVIEPVISMLHISEDTKLDFYYDTGESEDMEEDSRFYAGILERLISEYMNSTYGENYTVEVECKEGYSVESVVIENSEGTEEAEAGEEIRNNISSNFGISVEKISIK